MTTDSASLVPRAGRYTHAPGRTLDLSAGVSVHAPEFAPRLQAVAYDMLGLPTNPDGPRIDLSIDSGLDGPEAYRLKVDGGGITIAGGGYPGLVWGLATVHQLLVTADPPSSKTIPQVTVEDTPRFAWRGLSMDVARSAYPTEELKRLVSLLAAYKMNVLHLHLTDDQGWRLEVDGWPQLTEISGKTSVDGGRAFHYPAKELRELIKYAADRAIQVVPEVDIPGHVNAATHADGSLNPDGQRSDPYTGIEVGFSRLHVEAPGTKKFLEDVFQEAAGLSEEYVHLGGDEAFELKEPEYDQLVETAADVVTAAGKRVIAWQEAANAPLPTDAMLQYWDPRLDLTPLRDAAGRGLKLIMSPAPHTYLDMKYSPDTELGQDWAGYISVADAYEWDPADQIEGVAPSSIAGVEAAMWTEKIHDLDGLTYMLLPRLPAIAERAWSAEGGSTENLLARLQKQETWWLQEGFKFGPLS